MEAKQAQLQNLFIYILDCICIIFSYIAASYLRFGNLWGGYTRQIVFIRMGILLISITLIYLVFYPNRKFFERTEKQEFIAVFQNNLILGAIVTTAAFMMQDAENYSRLVYAFFCIVDVLIMFTVHQLYKYYMIKIYSKGIGTRNVLIFTTEDRAAQICENIRQSNSWNMNIAGIILVNNPNQSEQINDVPVVADALSMMDYVKKNLVD